ncbi:MAG TPA: hypothetical protein PKO06_17450, partial [Candidatus Ozemobacteraceae bacterium]|nr:hypothetical protein [Candidatus Ozemobacteraceae bacterium]
MPQAKRKPVASKKFTYADYCTWPEEVRCELIDGVVFDAGQGRPSVGPAPGTARFGRTMTPAPSRLHSSISVNLTTEMSTFFR